jgi:transposase
LKIDNIDVEAAVKNTQQLLEVERDISPALKSAMEMILLLVTVLLNRVTLNSKNSSKVSVN